MEAKSIPFSLKNIPLGSNKQYRKLLIAKTEAFLRRMRWKLFFEKNKNTNLNPIAKLDTYGFKSERTPPTDTDLAGFEEELMRTVVNVKFKKRSKLKLNKLQKTMKTELDKIKESNCILMRSDKTDNWYRMNKATHDKLLHDNITKEYRKD